tara:strand:+ start:26259 stop:27086 length:828 start_codon:yes stop_codon:yes gene_type:complete
VKAPAFEYMRPTTVSEAAGLLAASDGDARILSGGQSLVPMMNLRLAYPSALIDIARVAELATIDDRSESVLVGAAVTHARLEDGAAGDHWNGFLAHVAREIAYRGVRNRGTIGGSIAHADPAADWPVALAALGASVEIAGPSARRSVAVEDFVLGMFETGLEPDELVVGVTIPKLSRDARWSYFKVRRKAGAFADALAAVVVDRERGTARVAVGGVATGLRRIDTLECCLLDGADQATTGDRIEAALAAINPDMDAFHSRLHKVSLSRALQEALT